MGGGGGRGAEKLPQREKVNVYKETNCATSRLRDDQTVAWDQAGEAAGPTQTWAHTALVAAMWKEMRESLGGFPGPGQQQTLR